MPNREDDIIAIQQFDSITIEQALAINLTATKLFDAVYVVPLVDSGAIVADSTIDLTVQKQADEIIIVQPNVIDLTIEE